MLWDGGDVSGASVVHFTYGSGEGGVFYSDCVYGEFGRDVMDEVGGKRA